MRLKTTSQVTNVHQDMVVALAWNASNELFTCSDDKSILRWNLDGEMMGPVVEKMDAFITDIHWAPGRSGSGTEIFAISCTDGSFRLMTRSGKVEKKTADAHDGAITCIRWNYEGTSLLTCGEDGHLKIWSKQGIHRSTLLSLGKFLHRIEKRKNSLSLSAHISKYDKMMRNI
jgi:intraflagellar transport protein 80